MNCKLNKKIVIIAAICTIIPLNIIVIRSGIMNYILLYLPMIIGYILYFRQYENYSDKQKKIFNIAIRISILNFLAGFWVYYTSEKHINTFNDIGWDMIVAPLTFYITYFAHRIVSLILCIKLIDEKSSKMKILIIIAIVGCIFIILPQIFNTYNYTKIKAEIIFSHNYCAEHHYKGEFNREIPWKCKICGYSTNVINSEENVPIICYGCSLITGRCMECGLLQKDLE